MRCHERKKGKKRKVEKKKKFLERKNIEKIPLRKSG